MVTKTVHRWISTAFLDVPTKLLVWNCCLRFLKKYFNFPTGLVKISYRTGSKFRVIGQQFDGKSVFFVEDC